MADHFRSLALQTLIARRPFNVGSPDWAYRTRAAWTYLQMAMGVPANEWRKDPPPVTAGKLNRGMENASA